MKHFDKLLIVLLVLVIVGFRLNYYWDKIKTKSGTLDLATTGVSVLKTQETNVWKLDLTLSGTIEGTGTILIGDTDSTSYKSYDLSTGNVDIKYSGDWYSQFCYITFKPATQSKGTLKIDGDFIGD